MTVEMMLSPCGCYERQAQAEAQESLACSGRQLKIAILGCMPPVRYGCGEGSHTARKLGSLQLYSRL